MPNHYFTTPIYTLSQVARIVGIPSSTLADWTDGKNGLVTREKTSSQGMPSIPFVGLSEAYVLTALRRQSKISMQAIKKVVKKIKKEYGEAHPLASKRFYNDGADLFFQISKDSTDNDKREIDNLVRVKTDQIVFGEIANMFLQKIEYSQSGIAEVIELQGYKIKTVVDPRRSFGMPVIDRIGIRVSDIVGQINANEEWQNIAEGYGVSMEEIEDIARVNSRAA